MLIGVALSLDVSSEAALGAFIMSCVNGVLNLLFGDPLKRDRGDGVLIVEHRLGFVMANAGIDQSNVASPGDPQDRKSTRLNSSHT